MMRVLNHGAVENPFWPFDEVPVDVKILSIGLDQLMNDPPFILEAIENWSPPSYPI